MNTAVPRPVLVRLADQLRARLPVDASTGLPSLAGLDSADERALFEAGGNRVAAVAFAVDDAAVAARVLIDQVRRSDLLLCALPDGLVVLAAGLASGEVDALAGRLTGVLTAAGLRVAVGVAQRTRRCALESAGQSVASEARERATAGVQVA